MAPSMTTPTRGMSATIATIQCNEREPAWVRFTLKSNGSRVPLSDVSAFTLTIFDQQSSAIINSRNAQNVLNTAGGSYSADGDVEVTFGSDDNVIVAAASDRPPDYLETHIAVLDITYAGGHFNRLVEIRVRDIPRVP